MSRHWEGGTENISVWQCKFMFNKNTEHGANVIFVISGRRVGLSGGDRQTQSWQCAEEGGAWRREDDVLIANTCECCKKVMGVTCG